MCQTVVELYSDGVIKYSMEANDWREVAKEFKKRWNVPPAVGVMDGKHIAMEKTTTSNSGSLYRNYKCFFSIVLLAFVDADYQSMWADCGGLGHKSDTQISNASGLKEAIEDRPINLLPPDSLPKDDMDIPYFILADDAFALRIYLMIRSQQIATYRFSRGRCRQLDHSFFPEQTAESGPDVTILTLDNF